LYDFQENTDQNDGCGKIVKKQRKEKTRAAQVQVPVLFLFLVLMLFTMMYKSIMGIDQLYDCHRSKSKRIKCQRFHQGD